MRFYCVSRGNNIGSWVRTTHTKNGGSGSSIFFSLHFFLLFYLFGVISAKSAELSFTIKNMNCIRRDLRRLLFIDINFSYGWSVDFLDLYYCHLLVWWHWWVDDDMCSCVCVCLTMPSNALFVLAFCAHSCKSRQSLSCELQTHIIMIPDQNKR